MHSSWFRRKAFIVSTLLVADFSQTFFIRLRKIPFICSFAESFYHYLVLNFVKCCFWVYWYNHMILILYVDWFFNGNAYLHTWNKFNLVMTYHFLNISLYSMPNCGSNIFVSMVIRDINVQFSFRVFLIRTVFKLCRSQKMIWEVLSLTLFVSDLYYFFFKCLKEFTSETIWIWIFLCGKAFNYKFNLFNKYRAMSAFYFFLYQC